MKQKQRIQGVLAGLLVLMILTGCAGVPIKSADFRSRTKGMDVYAADCRLLNGTDNHSLRLQSGQTLRVTTDVEEGTLQVWIGIKDTVSLYQSNGIESGEFELPIATAGQYRIEVQGTAFKGTFEFRALTEGES